MHADGLDFVGIEAYVDPPGDDDPQKNTESLRQYIQEMKSRGAEVAPVAVGVVIGVLVVGVAVDIV